MYFNRSKMFEFTPDVNNKYWHNNVLYNTLFYLITIYHRQINSYFNTVGKYVFTYNGLNKCNGMELN